MAHAAVSQNYWTFKIIGPEQFSCAAEKANLCAAAVQGDWRESLDQDDEEAERRHRLVRVPGERRGQERQGQGLMHEVFGISIIIIPAQVEILKVAN